MLLRRLREPDRGRPRKTWKEVVDKDMNDLHIELTDVMRKTIHYHHRNMCNAPITVKKRTQVLHMLH